MMDTDIAVIGAGPAGLAAAVAASKSGAQVTLIDEYPHPGGQYLKAGTQKNQHSVAGRTEQGARVLLDQLEGLNLDLRMQTLVWGIEDHRLGLARSSGVEWLDARIIIIAAGARELVLPFPGWTIPGVMTLGAAQILVKAHGVLPGQRVLLSGSGPLLLAAAKELSDRGVQVLAVIEAVHLFQGLPHAPAVWGNWERLREGWGYLSTLRRRKIPLRFGCTVVRATGSDRVDCAIVAKLDRHGVPVAASEVKIDLDALCVGFGFIPNTELTQLAGCNHTFDPSRGGWVPEVDEFMQTSVEGIFAVGETAGIAGAQAAMLTGKIAGLAAACDLGFLHPNIVARSLKDLALPVKRTRRFGTMLNMLFSPSPGLNAIATEDTMLCRCEDITLGQVRDAVKAGGVNLNALKNHLRVGQGPCQGRTCGPLLARYVADEPGSAPSESGVFRVRPPLKPVPLGTLAQEISP